MNALKKSQLIATTVLGVTLLSLGGLLARVGYIEKHVTAEDMDKLSRQHDAKVTIMPGVGSILASDGTPLAVSVRKYNLFADPAFVVDPGNEVVALNDAWDRLDARIKACSDMRERLKLEAQRDALDKKIDAQNAYVEAARAKLAEALAPLLNQTPEEIGKLIEQNAVYASGDPEAPVRPRRFLWLAREVDEDFYNRFNARKRELRDEARGLLSANKGEKDPKKREEARKQAAVLVHAMDGVGFEKSIRREYPMGALAGHVVGIRNRYEGVDGMEHQLDDLLKGRPGQVLMLKDASRRTLLVQQEGYKPPENGLNVWLTIDPVIQSIVEEELAKAGVEHKAESGAAVLLDPATGRVVAMASWPPFDPSNYRATLPKDRRNHAFDPYEPGSIWKPFVASWALEKKVVTPTTPFDCHGGRWYDPTGRLVSDVHGYGTLTVTEILVKSSNVGMAEIGWRMGIPTLQEAVHTYGFGQRTGIEAPADEKGIVTADGRWNKGTLTSVSFGYEVAATPVQLVRGYATFANGGYLVTPRLIQAVEVEPGVTKTWQELAGPGLQKQILSEQTAGQMRTIMEGVFTYGTARSSASQKYRLFGKTGTAHIATHGTGHYDKQYNASFLAGGPMSNPRLVAVVTLHKPDPSHGHFGGVVAAPACTMMLERALTYMQVPGDQTPETLKPPARPGH